MKILHTADWHIGKILHKQDLHEDIIIFFDWLISIIQTEKIDILLVSGDIFDLANPSHRDTTTYFQTLYRLSQLKTKVIITGGNHDSVSLLEAPSTVLNMLDIIVVGGAKVNMEDQIVPCYNKEGDLECVVLAVPFLRDKDLRTSLPANEMPDKSKMTEIAIKQHYATITEISRGKYGSKVPLIAMGHMYMRGALTSDSEREIHIGSLSGLDSDIIPSAVDYMALGHIHKPQKVNNNDRIRYCGSPVFLDFSEKDYEKKIIMLVTDRKKINSIISIPIPKSREIVKFLGTLEEVTKSLANFKNMLPLSAFVELDVLEPIFDILKIQALEDFKEKTITEEFKILKSRISFTSNPNVDSLYQTQSKSISELSPLDIFRQKLSEGDTDETLSAELLDAYIGLLQELEA